MLLRNALAAALLYLGLAAAERAHFELDTNNFRADAESEFEAWSRHNSKAYSAGTPEFERRFSIWTENVEHLLGQRNGLSVEVNSLMDMHDDEFRESYLGHSLRSRPNKKDATGKAHLEYRYRYVVPEESVDWRTKGIVGPIKNQHVNGSKCGCCWSFATIATVESINALATGKMDVLSEQQLIACDLSAPYFDLGCKGGDFEGGMKYIIDNGGIALEDEYPYLAEDSKCNHKRASHRVVTIDAVEDVPPANETALEQAVTMHPTAIGLCVGPWIKEWRAYTGGIFKVPKNCEDPQDHAMPVVGYGTEDNGEKFWILKNSWGADWGEAGFLRLPRGMPGNGSLGLAANPGYPVKISANPHEKTEESSMGLMTHLWNDLFGRRAGGMA